MNPRQQIAVAELALYMLVFFDYQENTFYWADSNELKGRGGLLVGGCGVGKTEVMIALCILHRLAVGCTLWVTRKCLINQTRDRFCKYLAHQSQQQRVVKGNSRDTTGASACEEARVQTDSILVVSYTQLPKIMDLLMGMQFGRIIVDELQGLKEGNNNWELVQAISAAQPNARRWGLTASLFNNKWEDARIPVAWITGEDRFLNCSEDTLRSDVVRAVYKDNGMPVFYFKTAVPIKFLPRLVTKLLFIPYLDPVEAVMDLHVCGNGVQTGKALANSCPDTVLKAAVRDPCVPLVKKPRSDDPDDDVTSETTTWAKQREVVGLRPVGDLVAALARHGCMTIEEAREYLGGSTSGYVCTKARYTVMHLSLIHPDRPAIVVYSSHAFKSHFVSALSGARNLHIYGSQDDDAKLKAFLHDAMPFTRCSSAAPPAGLAPPILLASHKVVGTGIDGLQEAGCNVMYLTHMDDNPQQDLQCLQRIWRRGQTEKEVYVYTVMVSCCAELRQLQRQVEKAGSWRQPEYNAVSGNDAAKLLDIFSSKDQMPDIVGQQL